MSSPDDIDLSNKELRPLEDALYANVKETVSAMQVNEPMTKNFFLNSRGEKLHYKYYMPAGEPPKKLAVFIHGYVAHSNRPNTRLYGGKLSDNGIAFFTFDLHGHGYSEGLRGYIRNYCNLLDDVVCFLRLIFQGEKHIFSPDVNFRLTGQSMGGAIATAIGLLIHGCNEIGSYSDSDSIRFLQSLSKRHLGCILLCPALKVDLPPYIVQLILKWLVVPIFPSSEIPAFLSSNVNQNDLIWKNPRWIEFITSDGFPVNPQGLSWSGNVRFATGQSIIDFIRDVRLKLEKNNFPFIVVHDPADEVVRFEGTEFLMLCNANSSLQHELITLKGGLHDLYTNEIDYVSNLFVKSF